MASKMLGRCACPECGFQSAHVKISDKETSKAYRYCPECGSQYYARSQSQHDALIAKTTKTENPAPQAIKTPEAVSVPRPAPEKAATAPEIKPQEQEKEPVKPDNYKVIFGVRVPA